MIIKIKHIHHTKKALKSISTRTPLSSTNIIQGYKLPGSYFKNGTPLGKYPYTEGWNLLDMTSLLYLLWKSVAVYVLKRNSRVPYHQIKHHSHVSHVNILSTTWRTRQQESQRKHDAARQARSERYAPRARAARDCTAVIYKQPPRRARARGCSYTTRYIFFFCLIFFFTW